MARKAICNPIADRPTLLAENTGAARPSRAVSRNGTAYKQKLRRIGKGGAVAQSTAAQQFAAEPRAPMEKTPSEGADTPAWPVINNADTPSDSLAGGLAQLRNENRRCASRWASSWMKHSPSPKRRAVEQIGLVTKEEAKIWMIETQLASATPQILRAWSSRSISHRSSRSVAGRTSSQAGQTLVRTRKRAARTY